MSHLAHSPKPDCDLLSQKIEMCRMEFIARSGARGNVEHVPLILRHWRDFRHI
jgi:hypothetical protein